MSFVQHALMGHELTDGEGEEKMSNGYEKIISRYYTGGGVRAGVVRNGVARIGIHFGVLELWSSEGRSDEWRERIVRCMGFHHALIHLSTIKDGFNVMPSSFCINAAHEFRVAIAKLLLTYTKSWNIFCGGS